MDLTASDTVKRWSPTKKRKKEIKSHPVVNDYAHHMNGVDKKGRDTSDWTVSLKSYRFYLRIFYWTFDGVIHAMYCVIKNIVAASGDKKAQKSHPFSRYVDKDWGRYRFQMDLGIALINHGLSLDWKDLGTDKAKRPSYVRQRKDWVPCGCRDKGPQGQIRCFFCMHGMTHKIAHQDVSQKRATSSKARKVCKRGDLGYSTYCVDCISEVRAEKPGITLTDARKQAGAKAKLSNTKASGKFGCTTCKQHLCERHWEAHGIN